MNERTVALKLPQPFETLPVDPNHRFLFHDRLKSTRTLVIFTSIMSSTSAAEVKRPIRIAGSSGGFTDRVLAISRLAEDPTIDGIVGDWLSENVMTGYGAGKERLRQKYGDQLEEMSLEERRKVAQYASTFLQCFEPAVQGLAKSRAKLCVNAGASDTKLLAEVVKKIVEDAGFNLKVAWVEGDDVTDEFRRMVKKGKEFKSVTDGKTLKEWGFEPICAQAYLGSLGIAEALRHGADIVICGRVSDAAPTIGLAAWYVEPTSSERLIDKYIGGMVGKRINMTNLLEH
jgi:hypothetical protein